MKLRNIILMTASIAMTACSKQAVPTAIPEDSDWYLGAWTGARTDRKDDFWGNREEVFWESYMAISSL